MAENSAKKEVLQWLEGKHDGIRRGPRGDPEVGSKWYIIPVSFLNNWKTGSGSLEITNASLIEQRSDFLYPQCQRILKAGLVLGSDYELIPPKAWKFFKRSYPYDFAIKRKSVDMGGLETQVEVTLKSLSITVLHKGLVAFHKKLFASHHITVEELRRKIAKGIKARLAKAHHIFRIAKLNFKYTQKDLETFETLSETPAPITLLSDQEYISMISNDEIVVVDIQNNDGWNLVPATVLTGLDCFKCRKTLQFGVTCPCGEKEFCSDLCRKSYKTFHYCTHHSRPMRPSRYGKTGISNLGSTCYMSSGLQCLSNTFELTKYFLSGEFKRDINRTNPMGSGGRLAEEYTELLRDLWHGCQSTISPWKFKNALGSFARQFAGYRQQDSQEMLSFLLDGLHEDLNRVKQKPYMPEIQTEGLTEEAMANRFWEAHLLRNQSIIVETMHGQYRSEVTCPLCNHKSLTFDPFLMATLQIPAKESFVFDVSYVPLEGSILKLRVCSEEKTVLRVKNEIRQITNCDDLLLGKVTGIKQIEKIFAEDDTIERSYSLYAFEIPSSMVEHGHIVLEVQKESSISISMNRSPFLYPRVLCLPVATTMSELYRKVSDCLSLSKISRLFTLKFLRPNKFDRCPFCETLCKSCEVPENDSLLQDYLNKTPLLKIEVNLAFNAPLHSISSLDQVKNHESYWRLSSRKNPVVSIYDCLTATASPEQLNEMNTTYCGKCKEHVRGIKKMDIYKLPKVLIFHIKRFKQVGMYSSRNNKLVDFPVKGLNMAPYSLTGGGVYDLYAVSNHYGSLSFGHYTANAKNPKDGSWFNFDDSHVTPIRNESEIVNEAAYVLFYQLREI